MNQLGEIIELAICNLGISQNFRIASSSNGNPKSFNFSAKALMIQKVCDSIAKLAIRMYCSSVFVHLKRQQLQRESFSFLVSRFAT